MPLFDDDTTRAMIQTMGADRKGTYTPLEGGGGTEIDVDFRNEYGPAIMFEVEINDTVPVAFVVTSDITGTAVGGTLLVDSTTYKIIEGPHSDGEGMSGLVLSEVTP
jgi:hypothetical protein